MSTSERLKAGEYGIDTSLGRLLPQSSPTGHSSESLVPFADATNRPSMSRLQGSDSRELRGSACSTIKSRRLVADPAPSPAAFTFPARSSSESRPTGQLAEGPPARIRTKSTSSVTHPPIPDPVYPVRSQPIGLSRSSSLGSAGSFGSASDLEAIAAAPESDQNMLKLVDKQLKRLSLSSRSGSEAETETNGPEKPRPYRPVHPKRSESLPSFSFGTSPSTATDKYVTEEELATLPPNPKLWLPSHLSLYLTSTMSLPPPVRSDVTAFIRASRLSGRTFLRLTEADLEELGINVRWRAALLEARRILRRESLCGRTLWGFEGGNYEPAAATAAAKSQQHRRGGSWQGANVDVEGSASEDESSKDEWKRSWRASQSVGTRDRVKGLRRAFETVEEASESGTPEKKATTSPRKGLPSAWRHGRSDSASSVSSDASVDLAGRRDTAVSASTPSRSSAAGERVRRQTVALALDERRLCDNPKPPDVFDSHDPSSPSHATSLPFATDSPAPTRPASRAPLAQTPRMGSNGAGRSARQVRGPSISPVRRSRLPDSLDDTRNARTDADDSSDEDNDPTLRPVRSPIASPPMSPRTGGLAELFGLHLPQVSAGDTPRRSTTDELVPMLVVGLPHPRLDTQQEGDRQGTGGRTKKGSLVLVKKSQFAALQRRMAEVEAQLALALGSECASSGSDTLELDASERRGGGGDEWEFKGEEINAERLHELHEGLDRLEQRTTHLATSLPASPTPSARAFADLPSPPASASSLSLSTAYPDTSATSTYRRLHTGVKQRERSVSSMQQGSSVYGEDELPGVWPIEGWRQLSGYVVAASIGIGIVAGEVVAAKLLGLRRR